MKSIGILGLFLIFLGIFLIALSIAMGEGGVGFLFIIPFFYSYGPLGAAGSLLIFLGFFLLFISPFFAIPPPPGVDEPEPPDHPGEESEGNVHYGGIVLVGPIPIVFGSDKNHLLYALLGGFLMLLAIVLFFLIL